MLLKLDLSILADLEGKDDTVLHACDALADAHRKGKHYLFSDSRDIFDRLSQNNKLGDHKQKIFKRIAHELTQTRNILQNIPYYLRIVGRKFNIAQTKASKELCIYLDQCEDLISRPTCLLGENLSDCKWFKAMGEYYGLYKGLGHNLQFEEVSGGGSQTGRLYGERFKNCNQLSLCIIDSDKKIHGDTWGDTAQNLQEHHRNLSKSMDCIYVFYEILEVHEIENLLPSNLIEFALNNQKQKIPSDISNLRNLQNNPNSNDWMYLDVKKIAGADILNHVIDFKYGFLNKNYRVPDSMKNIWDRVGELVLAWGYAPSPKRT